MSGAASDDKAAIEMARSVVLYLLSVVAVSNALEASEGLLGPSPFVLVIWAATLGVSLVAGNLLMPHLEAIEEVKSARIRLFVAIGYLGVAVPGLLVSVFFPNPALVRMLVPALATLQPGFLVLAGLGRGRKGILANALILSFFACLPGGPLATATATSVVGLLGCFLVFDHYFRTLTAYATGPGVWLSRACLEAAKTVLPIAFGLLLFLIGTPPEPGRGWARMLQATGRDHDTDAMTLMTLVWVAGASGVYVAGRLLGRARRKAPPTLEFVEPIRGKVEHLPPPPERPAPRVYPGRRGRIVRAYVSFLSAAARAGLARKPHLSPREFALVVKNPPGPLRSLTETFVRARYGPAEPTEHDVVVAEESASALVQTLRFRQAGSAGASGSRPSPDAVHRGPSGARRGRR